MTSKILDEIQELFFEKLNSKTGWGKNDVKDLYKDCVLEILKKHLPQD